MSLVLGGITAKEGAGEIARTAPVRRRITTDKYSRYEIHTAFTRWLEEAKDKDWPEASDPQALTDQLINYMEEARKPKS